jgi:hypothetical protein
MLDTFSILVNSMDEEITPFLFASRATATADYRGGGVFPRKTPTQQRPSLFVLSTTHNGHFGIII